MEQRIKKRYNAEIFAATIARYGAGRDDVRLLDGFERFLSSWRDALPDIPLNLSAR